MGTKIILAVLESVATIFVLWFVSSKLSQIAKAWCARRGYLRLTQLGI